MNKKGLGKGLNALIGESSDYSNGLIMLKINDIEPNIHQPRKKFDDDKLIQLSKSIEQHGIIQPIIVKKEEHTYRIIAGERRWRAARLAGVTQIPVIIKEYSNQAIMEVALIENLQREDLNPIEEAEAFEKLVKEYKLTHEELSAKIGKSRPVITNSMRLLGLTEKVKTFLISGEISAGHARAILAVDSLEMQEKIADQVVSQQLNVRDTEEWIKRISNLESKKRSKTNSAEIDYIQGNLQNIFGTKVKIVHSNNKGRIVIDYFSNEELDRIIEMVSTLKSKE